MINRIINAIKKEKKEETKESDRINRKKMIIKIVKDVITDIRAGKDKGMGIDEKRTLVEYYWSLGASDRVAVDRAVSESVIGITEELYSSRIRGDYALDGCLKDILELQRLFDPKLTYLEKYVLSNIPVPSRIRLIDGYLTCPAGAKILNPEDAEVSRNACIIGFEDKYGIRGISRNGDCHIFVVLTEKDDITGKSDRERINKLCEKACPGIWGAGEDGLTAGYYMAPEHGSSRSLTPNPDYAYYEACVGSRIGSSHLLIEYPNGGIMIFRDNTARGQEE